MSIRLAADGFSLSVDSQTGASQPLQYEEKRVADADLLPRELHLALTRPRIMDYRYASVEIVADTPATFLPLEDFRSSEVAAVYRLCFPRTEAKADEIHYELLSSLEMVVLFAADSRCVQTVQRLYPDATLRSLQSLILEEARETLRRTKSSARHLFVDVGRERMSLCQLGKDKPNFACSYEATHDADRLYYILSVWKTLGLDVSRDVCHLRGASVELWEKLACYIHEITDS